jgi:chemotaxis protein MotB
VTNLRRRRTDQVSHERWLVSYADFVTLLFAFFVVLYASAQVDRQRALDLSDAIRSGFQQLGVFQGNKPEATGPQPVRGEGRAELTLPQAAEEARLATDKAADFAQLRAELQHALAPQIARHEVDVHMGPDGLIVTLREVGFFDSGSAAMKLGAEKAFAQVADILHSHSCALRIEGHTDNVPIHTSQFASNWELSTARATGLVKSLVDDHGISPALLSAAGYAEFHPASTNDTTEGRTLNRRVDLVILKWQQAKQSAIPVADNNPAAGS